MANDDDQDAAGEDHEVRHRLDVVAQVLPLLLPDILSVDRFTVTYELMKVVDKYYHNLPFLADCDSTIIPEADDTTRQRLADMVGTLLEVATPRLFMSDYEAQLLWAHCELTKLALDELNLIRRVNLALTQLVYDDDDDAMVQKREYNHPDVLPLLMLQGNWFEVELGERVAAQQGWLAERRAVCEEMMTKINVVPFPLKRPDDDGEEEPDPAA